MVSSIPSAVIGLTKDDAPSLAVAPSGRTRHAEASTARYCEYIAPPAIATLFPRRAWAADDDPAATTVPAPSLPTGRDLSSLAASPPRAACAIEAVTTGRSGVPATVAVVRSAPAVRRPKSDGLIGEASMRTSTSLAPGVGTGTSCSESSSVPSDVTNERNSSASPGKSAVMVGASFLLWVCLKGQRRRQLQIFHGVEVKPSAGAALEAATLMQAVGVARGLEESFELHLTTIVGWATRDGVDYLETGPGDARVNGD